MSGWRSTKLEPEHQRPIWPLHWPIPSAYPHWRCLCRILILTLGCCHAQSQEDQPGGLWPLALPIPGIFQHTGPGQANLTGLEWYAGRCLERTIRRVKTKRANRPNQNQLALFLWILKKCCQRGDKPYKTQSYQGFSVFWNHSNSLLGIML